MLTKLKFKFQSQFSGVFTFKKNFNESHRLAKDIALFQEVTYLSTDKHLEQNKEKGPKVLELGIERRIQIHLFNLSP